MIQKLYNDYLFWIIYASHHCYPAKEAEKGIKSTHTHTDPHTSHTHTHTHTHMHIFTILWKKLRVVSVLYCISQKWVRKLITLFIVIRWV